MLDLQEFDFDIYHLKGKSNKVADALSRNAVPREDSIDETEYVNCALICRKPTGYSSQEVAFL